MTTLHAITPEEANRIAQWVEGLSLPFTLTVTEGKLRTLSQNALVHVWFDVVSKHKGDVTLKTVKGQCNHKYGLPVRLQDPQFEWVWVRSGGLLTYEQQCSFLSSETIAVTSAMTAPQLRGYLDEMQRDYAAEGITLTTPEDRS